MKLSKSFAELDAMADELLAKSCGADGDLLKKSAEDSKGSKDKSLTPEDVSENVPDDEIEESPETAEESTDEEENPTEGDNMEKSMNVDEANDELDEENLAKSEEASDVEPEDEFDEKEEKEMLEKSIRQEFEGSEEIRKSIDASEFLSAVVEVLVKSLSEHSYGIKEVEEHSSVSNEVLAKSLQATLAMNKSMQAEIETLRTQNTDLVKSVNDGFDAMKSFISERMNEISHQPVAMRKSVGNISVHDRNFQKSLTGSRSGIENLSKSEVLGTLNNLMYSGNPLVTANDIISYESGAPLRPEVAQLISSKM